MADLRDVDRLAGRQTGLATTQQLRDLGFTAHQIRSLIRRGYLVRVRHNVVRVAGAPPSWVQTVRAATLAVPGSVASHWTAARLWAFPFLQPEARIHLLRQGVLGVRLDGVQSHTSLLLPASHRRVRDGVPVTSVERTIIDICGGTDPAALEQLGDELRRRKLLSVDGLRKTVMEVPVSGRRAIRPVETYLAGYDPSLQPGANHAELNILAVLRAGGVSPLPVQQHRVDIDARHYFVDYAWPELQQGLEFMGFNPHGNLVSRFHNDADRVRDLQRAGWRIWPITIRTPKEELIGLGHDITAQLRAA